MTEMMRTVHTKRTMHDACTPAGATRIAAVLELDPGAYTVGRLPRGWHVGLFTTATPHSALRPDGLGSLGFDLPDLGLPRVVADGRTLRFAGDIPIGAARHRDSRLGSVVKKQGRSGRLAVVSVEHEVVPDGAPVLLERQDYVMPPAAAPGTDTPAAPPVEAPEER